MLTYCFESSHIPRTLARCRKNDLAVVDTEGHEKAVREAVNRSVWVYGYLNVGALEKERSYYEKFHHIRLAPYDGYCCINQANGCAITRANGSTIIGDSIHPTYDNYRIYGDNISSRIVALFNNRIVQ